MGRKLIRAFCLFSFIFLSQGAVIEKDSFAWDFPVLTNNILYTEIRLATNQIFLKTNLVSFPSTQITISNLVGKTNFPIGIYSFWAREIATQGKTSTWTTLPNIALKNMTNGPNILGPPTNLKIVPRIPNDPEAFDSD